MTNCCLIDFKGMLNNGFKIGNAEVESPKSIKQQRHRSHRSLPMLHLANMADVLPIAQMNCLLLFAQLNYKKHLIDAKEWIDTPERQRSLCKSKTKKIFLMPCKVWNMRSIHFSLPTDKRLLLHSASV